MDMIDEVVSKFKQQKMGVLGAVDKIRCILDIVTSSDSEDAVPSGKGITNPHRHSVPPNRGVQPPPGTSSQPASAISSEATVGESAGHGRGLL